MTTGNAWALGWVPDWREARRSRISSKWRWPETLGHERELGDFAMGNLRFFQRGEFGEVERIAVKGEGFWGVFGNLSAALVPSSVESAPRSIPREPRDDSGTVTPSQWLL